MKITAALLGLVLPIIVSSQAQAVPWDRIEGYAALGGNARKLARRLIKSEFCYHQCSDTIAGCLSRKPRVDTAWRLARYLVFLARKGLSEDKIRKMLMDRARSVHPLVKHKIKIQGAPVWGSKRAPVRIVAFVEFGCPHCRKVSPLLKKLITGYKGQAAYYWKHYPIKGHRDALFYARLSMAVAGQGGFWAFHDAVFKNYVKWRRDDALKHARKLVSDQGALNRLRRAPALLLKVLRDKAEGVRLGVVGTPTLFVNGKKYHMRKDAHHLRERIEEELALRPGSSDGQVP